MTELKGLILSGGRGTRLRPITYTSAKQLVPVANKPVLFYGIEAMADAGIEDIGIIIAPETGDEIKQVTGDGSEFGVRITYILQDEPAGVRRLVEKPPDPQTNLALCGVYMFTAGIHDAARAIEPSGRGELEITDAIQHLVDGGRRVEPHVVQGWWKDTGRLDDMLEANRLILDTLTRKIDGELRDAQVDGRVVVEAGARLERATVRGPAIIGAGAVVREAYVGPYTAVGRHCVIERAEVEHSILLEGSSVRDLGGRMESSLLGRDVAITRDHRQPRAYRVMVGDKSEIGIL